MGLLGPTSLIEYSPILTRPSPFVLISGNLNKKKSDGIKKDGGVGPTLFTFTVGTVLSALPRDDGVPSKVLFCPLRSFLINLVRPKPKPASSDGSLELE